MKFCKTFCRKDWDVLADVGVGAIRRERPQERKYRVSENLFNHVKGKCIKGKLKKIG
jgi:hypothetical protein